MSGSLRGEISSWQLKTQEARSPVCSDNVLMEIKHGGQVGTKEEYLGSGQESRGPERQWPVRRLDDKSSGEDEELLRDEIPERR